MLGQTGTFTIAPNGVRAGPGDDLIVLDGTTRVNQIFGEDGNDRIELLANDATADGSGNFNIPEVRSGDGIDSILLDGATVSLLFTDEGLVNGGAETLDLTSGRVKATVALDGNVSTGIGNDIVNLTGAVVDGHLLTGDGADTVNLLGGAAGNVDMAGTNGSNLAENDLAILNGASVGAILMGDGENTVNLLSGSVIRQASLASARQSVVTGSGIDLITLNGAHIEGSIETDHSDDVVNLLSGTMGTLVIDALKTDFAKGYETSDYQMSLGNRESPQPAGTDNNTLLLNGAVIHASAIETGQQKDIVNLLSGSLTGGAIYLQAGDDELLLDGATVDLNIMSTAGGIIASDGNDLITLRTGSYTGSINSGKGEDTVNVLLTGENGIVDIELDADDDIVNIDIGIGEIAGDIRGGGGIDTITLISGDIAGAIDGNDGNDSIDLSNGGVIGAGVYGGSDDDGLDIQSATIGSGNANDGVSGGRGTDIITIGNTDIDGNIEGDTAVASASDGNNVITLGNTTVSGFLRTQGGDNTITLNTSSSIGSYLTTGSGADIVNVNSGSNIASSLTTRSGIDIININSGGIVGVGTDIDTGEGNDSVTLNSGKIGSSLLTREGNDAITLNGGTVGGNIFAGENTTIDPNVTEDTIIINGALVEGGIFSDRASSTVVGGNDVIKLQSGTVVGIINAEGGNDALTFTGGLAKSDVFGGKGDDTFIFDSVVIEGKVFGNTGESDAAINEVTDDNFSVNLSTTGNITGSGGDNTFTVTDSTTGSIIGADGADTITINKSNALGVNGGTSGSASNANDGNDIITVSNASVVGEIFTGRGNDIVTVTDSVISTFIESELNDSDGDTITLNSSEMGEGITAHAGDNIITINSSTINTSGVSYGIIFSGSGQDQININTNSIINSHIETGAGADTINLNLGDVFGHVDGQGGNNTINLNNVAVTSYINTDEGNDLFNLNSGSSGKVWTGFGDDVVNLDGSTVAGIEDWFGTNTYNLNSGISTADVLGGADVDFINLAGATIIGSIVGDEGSLGGLSDDIITLTSGSVSDHVFGLNGNDIIRLDGASVAGYIIGDGADPSDDGDDTIELTSGSIGGGVLGNGGNDSITLSGNIAVTLGIEGGEGNDHIDFDLNSTVSVGGQVLGDAGNDLFTLRGNGINSSANDLRMYEVANQFLGGTGDDIIEFSNVHTNFAPSVINEIENIRIVADSVIKAHTTTCIDPNTGFDFEPLGCRVADEVDGSAYPNVPPSDQGDYALREFTGAVFLQAASILDATGNSPGLTVFEEDFTHDGILTMGDSDSDDVVLVDANYIAASTSEMTIDTELNDGITDNTDLLTINGNSSGGTVTVKINNVGGAGGLTGTGPTDGILVVQVMGDSGAVFTLDGGSIIVSTFEYSLVKADGQNWYLQSDVAPIDMGTPAGIPTLGQWFKLILILLLMTSGLFYYRRERV